MINKNMVDSWKQLALTPEMSKHILWLMGKEMNVEGEKLQYHDFMSKLSQYFRLKVNKQLSLDD